MIDRCCKRCHSLRLIVLETLCTEPYQDAASALTFTESLQWYRDIKQRCVCDSCGLEQDIIIDTVKQPEMSK